MLNEKKNGKWDMFKKVLKYYYITEITAGIEPRGTNIRDSFRNVCKFAKQKKGDHNGTRSNCSNWPVSERNEYGVVEV